MNLFNNFQIHKLFNKTQLENILFVQITKCDLLIQILNSFLYQKEEKWLI